MKKRFHVKKRTLLLIAGIVWLIAGFNVARLGILSYRVIDRKWYLYLFSVVVLFMFGMMFYKMSKKHTKRILGYESHRPFWHFFDLKAYLIMTCMMSGGMVSGQREYSRYLRCFFLFRSRLCTGPGGGGIYQKLFLL